jgi:ABC-type proline/glycine betaine transport system permease subunit
MMIANLIQDLRHSLRQLKKTPGFTLTAVLTLALGIGANAAIFTLVHAVLLKNLPVTDPKTLLRLGDNNDCCVGWGAHDDGDYALFSTDTYEQLKKNAPEFEELAAMQAGFRFIQTVLGLAIGIPVALLCVRFVKAQLYEITGANVSVLASGILTLAAAACVAGLIPARRAASVEPQTALRHE